MITVIYGKERVHFSDEGAASGASLKDESSASSISINFSTTTIAEFKHTLLSWWQNEHKQPSNTNVQLSSVEEIKLILNGKILSNADQLLMDLFPASDDGTTKKALKVTMVANPLTQEAIQQLQSEKQKQEELASKLKRRKLAASKAKSSLEGRRRQPITYGFHRITTLANLPNEEKAKAILEQLANDPGVIAVMNKYKFTVNELTELYPEGQVGVSDVCVMGLNENHGQKILLRLRTDDLKGFRKLLSIKKVLYHELAHNIYSEHDNNFYILMRQIEKDANELSWEKSRGFSLLSARERESYIRPEKHFDDEEEEEQEQTVFTLGGSDSANVSNPTVPARRVAGEAAILRFHQFQKQKEEQKYNQYVKNTSSSSSTSNQNSDEFISEKSNVDGKEHFQRHSDSEGTEGTDSGSEKEQGSSEKKDGSTLVPMEVEDVTVSVVDYIATNSKPIHNEPDQLSEMVVIENPSGATLTPSNSGPSTIEIAKKKIDEPKDVAMEETKRIERLERKKEEINKMFEDSVVMILADETLISTVEKILSIKDIVFRIIDEKILNQDRFKQLIDTIQLFVTILQNIQNHPGEEKYKRIKKTNKIFQRTIDGMEESLGILYQSGFEEETSSSSASELIYKKKDTGLLYLVKSLLESILRILKEE